MRRRERSEGFVCLHIKRLPEGLYLATSNDVQGLVAQGRTIAETIEIARDVARRLLDAQGTRKGKVKVSPTRNSFDYPLIVSL